MNCSYISIAIVYALYSCSYSYIYIYIYIAIYIYIYTHTVHSIATLFIHALISALALHDIAIFTFNLDIIIIILICTFRGT